MSIAPAAASILSQATALWPTRNRASDGLLGDPAHAARTSDHNPGHNGLVHAADLTHDPAAGVDCNVLAEQIKDDRRVKYIIFNRRIWTPTVSRTWRPYSGSNPHTQHMHVSVTDADEYDSSPWFTAEGADEMTDADRKWLQGELVNQDKRQRAMLDAELKGIRDEVKGLHNRTGLTRRICRALAHNLGVTQPEIDSQA